MMPQLHYKTRGNANPQGKPRVYFCCHPDDFSLYFERITDEILNKQNCAIWYDPENGSFDEDRQLDLSQMQLFVLPVTEKLLTSENRVLQDEFPFAAKHHIPILPLIQEKGLDELFNKKFGALHFLDRSSRDIASSYDEKLEKYLSSVLIGDELAEKVRAAFDAYVFLSYRKKDRKYAQELMRLIHKNDFARNIAIWYDEFLIPGENFNDAIFKALTKSDLFAIAVTPNLIKEINYVMTTEYPAAQKAGKTIFPVEFVETDRQELKEKYHDMPACVDAYNESEFCESLFSTIKHLALQTDGNDPQHDYFVGLAYLNGIDVEVDHDRGIMLITSAAEAGFIDAMRKLVSIYENGSGTVADIKSAIYWQTHIVDQMKKCPDNVDVQNDKFLYAKELWSLGDLLQKDSDLHSAEKTYYEMNNTCEDIFNTEHDVQSVRYVAISELLLGDALRKQGKPEAALDLYQKVKHIFELLIQVLFDRSGSFVYRDEYFDWTIGSFHDLYVIYERMGRLYMAQREYEEAEKLLCSKLRTVKKIAMRTQHPIALRDLSGAYHDLGILYRNTGRDATAYFEEACVVSKKVADETKDEDDYALLSVDYINCIVSLVMSKMVREARKVFDDCYQYFRGIETAPVRLRIVVEFVANLNESLSHAFGVAEAGNDLIENGTYGDSIIIFKDIVTIIHNVGIEYYKRSEFDLARTNWEKGIEIGTQHPFVHMCSSIHLVVAYCYEKLSTYYSNAGNQEKVIEYVRKVDSICQKIELLGNNKRFLENFCYCYKNIWYTLDEVKISRSERKTYYLHAIHFMEQVCPESEVAAYTVTLGNLYEELADIYIDEGDIVQSISYRNKAIKHMKLLFLDHPDSRWGHRYSTACKKVYQDLLECEDYAAALDVLLDGYKTYKTLAEQLGNLDYFISASYRIDDIYKYYKKFENYEKVIEYLLVGMDIDEHIVEMSPSAIAYRDLSLRCEDLGYAYGKNCESSKALKYFKKAIQSAEKATELDQSQRSYERLMYAYGALAMTSENGSRKHLLKKVLELLDTLISFGEDAEKYTKYAQSIQDELSSME